MAEENSGHAITSRRGGSTPVSVALPDHFNRWRVPRVVPEFLAAKHGVSNVFLLRQASDTKHGHYQRCFERCDDSPVFVPLLRDGAVYPFNVVPPGWTRRARAKQAPARVALIRCIWKCDAGDHPTAETESLLWQHGQLTPGLRGFDVFDNALRIV